MGPCINNDVLSIRCLVIRWMKLPTLISFKKSEANKIFYMLKASQYQIFYSKTRHLPSKLYLFNSFVVFELFPGFSSQNNRRNDNIARLRFKSFLLLLLISNTFDDDRFIGRDEEEGNSWLRTLASAELGFAVALHRALDFCLTCSTYTKKDYSNPILQNLVLLLQALCCYGQEVSSPTTNNNHTRH